MPIDWDRGDALPYGQYRILREQVSTVWRIVKSKLDHCHGTQWRDMERRIASMQQSMEDIDTLREMAKALRVVFESEPGWDDR
jgi:hypothetical protein